MKSQVIERRGEEEKEEEEKGWEDYTCQCNHYSEDFVQSEKTNFCCVRDEESWVYRNEKGKQNDEFIEG